MPGPATLHSVIDQILREAKTASSNVVVERKGDGLRKVAALLRSMPESDPITYSDLYTVKAAIYG